MSVAPFLSDLAEGPDGGHALWLTTGDGVRIRASVWPDGEKGTVVLLPGRTEYVEKYGRAAESLRRRGFATVSVDWRGQGMAARALPDPMVGHIADFAEYQADLDAVLGMVAARGLPEPLFLMAHSMGGCIGLRALTRGLPFRAAAFSAPMWGISMAAWMRPLAHVVSSLSALMGQTHRYAPGTGGTTYVLEAAFQGNLLTTDPEMWDYMRRQAQAHPQIPLGGPSLGWLNAALRECGALALLPSPPVPVVTALGTAEKIVDVPPIHMRMAQWSDGRLDLYSGAEHEVMMETPAHRDRFFDAACDLFDRVRQA